MIVRIQNYTMTDVVNSAKFLLDRAVHSPEVRQLAVQITYDKQDKISAVYDWMKSSVSYISDPLTEEGEIELFISPIKQVRDFNLGLRPSGDCEDHALLATSLYKVIGINSNVIIIDSIGNGFDHAYSRAFSNKLQKWISVDSTSDYPLGWEIPHRKEIVI